MYMYITGVHCWGNQTLAGRTRIFANFRVLMDIMPRPARNNTSATREVEEEGDVTEAALICLHV
jgi:hypothetical protein